MQLVSRKILDDLCLRSRGEVVEAESEFSYSEFLEEYAAQVKASKSVPEISENPETATTWVYNQVKNGFLKQHCPPVRYINEGSSRAAYACSGGKCLKVAVNKAGIAQNKQEIKNVPVAQTYYSCFPQNFAYDEKTSGSILTECCAPCTSDDFCDIYGVAGGLEDICDFFRYIVNKDCELGEITAELRMDVRTYCGLGNSHAYETSKSRLEMALNMAKPNPHLKYQILKDLLQFYIDNGSTDEELTINDLEAEANWGVAYRNGELVPVIIDAGFSDRVYQDFYSCDD